MQIRSPRTQTRAQLRFATIISLVTVSITAFAGLAHAAPAPTGPVKFTVSSTSTAMSIAVDHGSISTDRGTLTIRNLAHAVVFSMPLAYRSEYRQFPIDAHTSGATATLIPSRDLQRSTAVDRAEVDRLRVTVAKRAAPKPAPQKSAPQIVGPQTRQQRDDEALGRFNQQLGTGMTISSIVGTALGAIVGGVLGCFVTVALGCVPGFLTGASVGSVAGLILGGGGSLIGAAVQYFQTINSPFVPQTR